MLKFSTHVKQGGNTNGLACCNLQEKAISFEGTAIQLFGVCMYFSDVRICFLYRDDHHGAGCMADDFLSDTAH